MYSVNEDQFNLNLKAFHNAIDGLTILPQGCKNEVPFMDYFSRNWENCKEMWALYFRSEYITLGDRTNNPIERTFRSLKDASKKEFWSAPSPEGLVVESMSIGPLDN